jgi:hypothetical protein
LRTPQPGTESPSIPTCALYLGEMSGARFWPYAPDHARGRERAMPTLMRREDYVRGQKARWQGAIIYADVTETGKRYTPQTLHVTVNDEFRQRPGGPRHILR